MFYRLLWSYSVKLQWLNVWKCITFLVYMYKTFTLDVLYWLCILIIVFWLNAASAKSSSLPIVKLNTKINRYTQECTESNSKSSFPPTDTQNVNGLSISLLSIDRWHDINYPGHWEKPVRHCGSCQSNSAPPPSLHPEVPTEDSGPSSSSDWPQENFY